MPLKIVFSSNSSRFKTGFGKHAATFLKYFYSLKNPDGSRKFEVVEFAQGVSENDPALKIPPWKAYGLTPATEEGLLEGLPNDPGIHEPLKRMIGYGAARTEELLKKEKPDYFFICEDCWGAAVLRRYTNHPFLPMWDCEWWNKANCVLWTPVDSLPIHHDLMNGAPKIKNLWLKAKFGVEEIRSKGHKHAELYPLLLDTDNYRTFNQQEKQENRKNYGIAEDELIIGFTFRNQGRKKIICLCEGFKLFLDRNPGVKAKLLLVTNPFEGWDIHRAVREIGIDPQNILFTYVCHACGETTLVNGLEREHDCPKCRTSKSLKHITVDKGITEGSLVEVYNLMDGYAQVANSGGFEAGCLEAMMCSIPLAAPNYSYGETFVDSREVFPLEFTFDREIGSNFKKAVIYPESVAEFIQKIHDNPVEMEKCGQRGKIWAEENLNYRDILKKVENFIENTPPTGYNWDFCIDFPNANAEMPEESLEDVEFCRRVLQNILGREVPDDHNDIKDMVRSLGEGITKKEVYERCILLAKKQREARDANRIDPKKYLKETGRKRILYEMAGNYGDGLISLNVLDELHNTYPDYDIYISTPAPFKEIYSHLDYLAGWIPFTGFKDFKFWEGSRHNEKLVDIYISPQQNSNFIHNGLA